METAIETQKLVAFHGDPAIKEKYLTRVREHAAADEIIQGKYWEKGKGCAVGCTIHGSDHRAYETEMGIPRSIAILQDKIFERLPLAEAKEFPAQFIEAIPVGADLSLIVRKFMIWDLTDSVHGLITYVKKEEGKQIFRDMAAALESTFTSVVPIEMWWKIRDAARSAARSADAYVYAYASASADASAYVYAYAYASADADASAYVYADASAYVYAYAYADAKNFNEKCAPARRDKLIELLKTA